MKKRILFAIMVCIILCGCGKKANYSDEEYNLMAEYVSGILIDHAYVNEDRYAYRRDDIVVNPIPEPTTKEDDITDPTDPDNPEDPEKNLTEKEEVARLLCFDGLETEYLGALVCETYPPDGFIYVQADDFKQYLVFEFVLKNNTSEDRTITLNNGYYLYIDDKQYHNFTSGLINEVSSLKSRTIAANTEYKTVIMFHIPADSAKEGMKLTSTSSSDNRYATINTFKKN